MTWYDLLYKIAVTYYATNNAFILINRDSIANTMSLYPLTPSSVETTTLDDSLAIKFNLADGSNLTLDYNDVIHLRRHFYSDDVLGSQNTPLYDWLETADTLRQGINQSVKNGVAIKGLLKFTSLVNPQQQKIEKQQFVQDFMSTSTGIATTDQRYDFQAINQNQYNIPKEQLNAVNEQIYNYLGISEKIIKGEYNEDEFDSFFESVIEPFAILLSLEFSKKLKADIKFGTERLDFTSAKTRITLIHECLPAGVLTINEARELLSLPPIETGDKTLQSLNYVEAEKANEYQEV